MLVHRTFLPCAVGLTLTIVSCGSGVPADTSGMVFIAGGEFTMGTNRGFPYEGPPHRVALDSFYLDEHEATNAQYAAFAEATGYVTDSEKLGWSGVFDPEQESWTKGDGADWRHPDGPGSSYKDKLDYPVVHLSWQDAAAYCDWQGRRLPTEAEFEYAIRGGLEGARYPWGDELTPGGVHRANLWQGSFPQQDLRHDGFAGYGPVKQFPANAYGLYDITGNVWEWAARLVFADILPGIADAEPPRPAVGRAKGAAGRQLAVQRKLLPGLPLGGADDDRTRLRPQQPGLPLRRRRRIAPAKLLAQPVASGE